MNSSVGYLIKKGVANMWLNKFMSLASIGILTACLIILGGAGLLSVNLRDVFRSIESQNEIYVFMLDETTDEQLASAENALRNMEHVTSVTYVSREEGLETVKESLGDDGYLFEGFEDESVLPPAFHVALDDQSAMGEVLGKIERMDHVDRVSAPTQIAEALTGFRNVATILGAIIIGILLIASIVVINNTIRLTVFARRKEINIMKYVGATNGFIRLPFMVEGISLGVLSAAFSFVILFIVYESLQKMLSTSAIAWLSSPGSMIPFTRLWFWVLGSFLAGGILIGMFGSTAAVRRHLQV